MPVLKQQLHTVLTAHEARDHQWRRGELKELGERWRYAVADYTLGGQRWPRWLGLPRVLGSAGPRTASSSRV